MKLLSAHDRVFELHAPIFVSGCLWARGAQAHEVDRSRAISVATVNLSVFRRHPCGLSTRFRLQIGMIPRCELGFGTPQRE
jgi:hypothetical protein